MPGLACHLKSSNRCFDGSKRDGDRATPRPLWNEIRSTKIDRGFLKRPCYGRLRMPQSSR
jgi:hypothetical protein